MCGICGVIGGDAGRERIRVERMARALAHRGPDADGFYADERAVLGHRRLSIIDLDTGDQPLSNEDGSLWIVFNGEIYNYRELRAELVGRGHRFRTRGDTEVILHLFEEEGAGCVRRLRGMFAFAIWDRRRGELFAARDPFGQKPFFFTICGGRFLFASEIKGLLAHPDVHAEPDPAAVDSYLAQRFVPPPLTMFRGIQKLAAGHTLHWRVDAEREVRTRRYWEPRFEESAPRTDGEWVEELHERVDDAVRAHLVSDVPVGALLSGGVDSSLVVALAAKRLGEPLRTFCVGSDDASFDERRHAAEVAAHCGTLHQEEVVDGDLLGELSRIVRCLDEPSDPISACAFAASRLAARHVKVVLGGDGGDEVFAGFDRYAAFGVATRYAALPAWLRERLVRPAVRRIPESFAYKSFSQRARWLDALGGLSGGRLYARMTSVFRFGPTERAKLYGPLLRREAAHLDAEAAIAAPFDAAPTDVPLHRMLYADMHTRLPEHTLMLADRLSMAHGLELRAPLLDPELAAFTASMPPHLLIRGGVTKFAMREAARPLLPRAAVRRKKQGFQFPVAEWLGPGELERVRRALGGGPLVEHGWIAATAVDELAREHRARRTDHHVRIWMLLSLDAWHRIHFGGAGGPARTSAAFNASARRDESPDDDALVAPLPSSVRL
jgi:asparagine synthase (glutamine-hydrolysing)